MVRSLLCFGFFVLCSLASTPAQAGYIYDFANSSVTWRYIATELRDVNTTILAGDLSAFTSVDPNLELAEVQIVNPFAGHGGCPPLLPTCTFPDLPQIQIDFTDGTGFIVLGWNGPFDTPGIHTAGFATLTITAVPEPTMSILLLLVSLVVLRSRRVRSAPLHFLGRAM